MEDITSSSKANGPYITILVIALGALVSTCVVLALVHLIFIKYCKRRRETVPTFSIERCTIGLDKRVLNTIPILFYSTKTCDLYRVNQNDQCVICLGRFIKGDLIRRIPICGHIFHLPCIDNWFHAHSTCPICRSLVRVDPVVSNKIRDQVGDGPPGGGGSCITRTRSGGLLCHCDKMLFPIEGLRPNDLISAGLNRSLSMDQFSVMVDTSASSPSSSSSYDSHPPLSKIDFVLRRLYHDQSMRHLERMYSMAPRLLHGLIQGGGTLRNNGILPY